ncbi:putative transcription factor Hap3/NF-YB family [Helianthus anomalus]
MAEGPGSPGSGGRHESGVWGGPEPEVVQCLRTWYFLQIKNISRIMKKGLPATGKMTKDAKETVQECFRRLMDCLKFEPLIYAHAGDASKAFPNSVCVPCVYIILTTA